MGEVTGAELRAFLTKLATEERISAATQRQALNALVFFFREVEGRDLGNFSRFCPGAKTEAGAGGLEPEYDWKEVLRSMTSVDAGKR